MQKSFLSGLVLLAAFFLIVPGNAAACGDADKLFLSQVAMYSVPLGLLFLATYLVVKRLVVQLNRARFQTEPFIPRIIAGSTALLVTVIVAFYIFFFLFSHAACF